MTISRLALVSLAVSAAFAAPARADDLIQVYREARGYDAQFASAQAALDAGRERLPQGRALLLPTVTASAFLNYNDVYRGAQFIPNPIPGRPSILQPGTDQSVNFNSNGWQVQLSQPIFRWQNIVQYQQAEFQVMQSEAQYANAVQDLVVRVAQAYFDVLAAQDNLDFVRAQRRAIGEQLAQAKRNFEVGTATITDTNEAQARFDLNTAQEINAQNEVEVRRRVLAQYIGRMPERLAPLRFGVLLDLPAPNNLEEWAKAAAEQSYNVRVQEAAYEIARKEIERQRAGHLPTLDAVATYSEGTNLNRAFVGPNQINQQIYALQLTVPIFQGGSVLSRTREAASNAERARQDLENARRTATLDAQRSFLAVSNGLAQVKALEQALTSSEVSLASNRVGYEVGVRINIDVLNAEQQVTSTRRDLAAARYNTIMSGLRLKQAAGTLSEEDVIRVNTLLAQNAQEAVGPQPGSGSRTPAGEPALNAPIQAPPGAVPPGVPMPGRPGARPQGNPAALPPAAPPPAPKR
jgi:outer membrane protein